MGAPAVLISDGAVELQESAEQLKTLNKDLIVLRDIKHLAANILEKTVRADEDYREFASNVSQTHCAIQQTELGQLTPPPGKSQARFMNLAPVLKWERRTLWLHDHQAAKGREGIAEVAESTFGLGKQLKGQHSKGGFTRLLPAIATLSKGATGESVRRHFAQVSVQQARDWIATNLPKRWPQDAEAANAIATRAQQNQTHLNCTFHQAGLRPAQWLPLAAPPASVRTKPANTFGRNC
jgi:hypothetical protein